MGLSESIINLLTKKIAEAPFDKTLLGVIESVDGSECVVQIEGGKYTVKTSSTYKPGDVVKVCFPRNTKQNLFIVGESNGSSSSSGTDVGSSEYVTHEELATHTSNMQTQLSKKADDYSIQIYNGTGGNPKPVKFATVNYSTCDSENGVAMKIGMVSGHGNGSSYAFLQDAIIRVNYLGSVEIDNFKYYGAETPTYDGEVRAYGDIFGVIDDTNKIVDFYCLMGQYSRLNMIPWKRVTYSSGGTVTQYTSASVYSNGTKVWANNGNIVTMSDIEAMLTEIDNALADI